MPLEPTAEYAFMHQSGNENVYSVWNNLGGQSIYTQASMRESVEQTGPQTLRLDASGSFLPVRLSNFAPSTIAPQLDGVWAANVSNCFQTVRFDKVRLFVFKCGCPSLIKGTLRQGLCEVHRTGTACGGSSAVLIGALVVNADATIVSVRFSYIRTLTERLEAPSSV